MGRISNQFSTFVFATGMATATAFAFLFTSSNSLAQDVSDSRDQTASFSPQLNLSVSPSTVALLNSSSSSCAHSPVPALRLNFGKLAINWSGASALTSSTVVVAFQSAAVIGGQYLCHVDGKEFDAVFGTLNSSLAKNSQVASGCDLQCGGVQLVNAKAPFQALGAVTVFGVTQVGHVQQQTSVPIEISFAP